MGELDIGVEDMMEIMKHKILESEVEQKCWKNFLNVARQDEKKLIEDIDLYVKAVDKADLPYMQKWFVTAAWAKKHSHHFPKSSDR